MNPVTDQPLTHPRLYQRMIASAVELVFQTYILIDSEIPLRSTHC